MIDKLLIDCFYVEKFNNGNNIIVIVLGNLPATLTLSLSNFIIDKDFLVVL